MHKDYEMVIGLEVHVELKTNTKIFCGCRTAFGQEPNTQVCPVCLGLPGSLPVLNKEVVNYAVKAGLSTSCRITPVGKQDRKNYFYPDLAKAYQISQYDQPICENGFIEIEDKDFTEKIGITRIHIEEDAGKLIHHPELGTLIDYNRAGVPLIEIVSEPDIRSSKEAIMYLKKLRGILLYIDASDCKMNEGSFRCDVNLSIRKKGEKVLGTRTEMKNLNSFSAISKAIENEYLRQIKVLEMGGQVTQETRRWDQDKKKSIAMRSKEDAHDYRYFPDPDLMPILISSEMIQTLKSQLPELPDSKKVRYINKFGLMKWDADQMVLDKKVAEFFERTVEMYPEPKAIANMMISDIIPMMNKLEDESTDIPLKPEDFVELIRLMVTGELNTSLGKRVLEKMWEEGLTAKVIMERDDLKLLKDEKILKKIIQEVLDQNSKVLQDYLSGKEKALQALIGQVMGKTQGKADPELTKEYVLTLIKQ